MAPIVAKKPVATTQVFPDLAVEPIQASTVIIIHPGSMFLRIGRASDTYPHIIPHVIARRHKIKNSPKHEDNLLVPVSKMSADIEASMDEVQAAISGVLASCITDQGETRYSVSLNKVHEHNINVSPEIIKSNSDVRWTKVDNSQEFLVGEEVLYLNPSENFNVHWPIRRGQFNIHPSVGGSLSAVSANLETIWGTVIQKYLDIPLNDLKLYRAVLVIPDVYRREHVKEIISLLLTKLEFSSCFVHLESVCATFGAGLSYACVVDVGDQKTNISCVEDGISHRNTRLCMEYGGSDVTQLFHWMQQKCGVPYEECLPPCMLDSLLLRDLKETLCHVNLNVYGPQDRSFLVKHPDKPVHRYMIQVGDECLIAPLALLHPELFALTGPKEVRMLQRSAGHPEDPHDELYLFQTQRRGIKDTTEGPSEPIMADDSHLNSSILDEDMDSTDPPSCVSVKESEQDPTCVQLLGIDQAIIQSIECCDSDELKRKMYSCILVVGGGMMFHGIHTYLRNRLSVQIPITHRGEPIDIITRPKDMDPRITTWKGASVMSCLDTAQELWIRRAEWMKYSVKLLRERAPFTW